MELQGKLIEVLERRSGVSQTTGKTWVVQEFVIEEQDTQYPHHLCFQIFGEEKLKNYEHLLQVGNIIKVHFDIDATKWKERWFTKISAWKIESTLEQAVINQSQQTQTFAPAAAQPTMFAPQPAPTLQPATQQLVSASDDLPF